MYIAHRYGVRNALSTEVPDSSRIAAIKEQFLQLRDFMDLQPFLSGWFHDAPFEVCWLRWPVMHNAPGIRLFSESSS